LELAGEIRERARLAEHRDELLQQHGASTRPLALAQNATDCAAKLV
jgi:hypothetical protein